MQPVRLAAKMAVCSVLLVPAGCASSYVLVGKARPPISPEQVQIYLQPPPRHYEQIATLDASSGGSLTFTDQQKTNKAIERLKKEAASLGANGILLQGVTSRQVGAVGTGLGTGSFNGNTAWGTGLSTSFGLHVRAAKGLAIYVSPQPAPAPAGSASP